MAKTRFLAARPSVVVVRSPGRARRAFGRAGGHIRRHARRAGRSAVRSLPLLPFIGGSLALGWADAKGYLDRIPGDSKMLGLGILGIGAVKLSRNPWIRSAGFSALSIAGFDFGRVNLGGVKGYLDGDSAGGGKGSGQGPY